ncbi:MAG TPA: HU family DNA-binding protein [Nitrospiria bacterium]|jgi:DNA-binding protein HU-beta
MTKEDLIEKMAESAGISKLAAGKSLLAFVNGVSTALKNGQKVTMVGFGTFSISQRKARKGRNPRTGKEIMIPETRSPKFSAGKALKSAVKLI